MTDRAPRHNWASETRQTDGLSAPLGHLQSSNFASVALPRLDSPDASPEAATMKILVAPATVVIPAQTPSTRRGPDSRGIRLLAAEIGRSCMNMQGFITFTDGSQYSYDAPSNSEFEALCDSLIRGRQFNFSVRRPIFGFTRSPVLPADYEVIYTFPPYAGSRPTSCALPPLDWTQLLWAQTAFSPGSGETWAFNPLAGMSDTEVITMSTTVGRRRAFCFSVHNSRYSRGRRARCLYDNETELFRRRRRNLDILFCVR